MILRIVSKILILLLISSAFSKRLQNCFEVDSVIKLRISQNDNLSAFQVAKSNRKMEDKDGCNASFYYNLGTIFLSFDDFNKTRDMYSKALKIASEGNEYNDIKLEYSRLSFLLSEISFIKQIYENDQDEKKAIKNYKGLLKGNSLWDNGEPYVDLNKNLAFDDGEEFTDWSFPSIGYLHLLISDIYKKSEDFNTAIYHLREALSINPNVKSYNDQIAVISKMIAQKANNLLRLNKLDEAIEKYELSISIDDKESAIHYNLANAYFQKKEYSKAIESYKNVEKLDPNKFKALHKMGQCYQKIDDHSLAVVQFEKSIDVIESLNENFMSSYNEMALSLMKLNDYENARRALLIIINKSPKYFKAYETLGVLCLESTDPKFKSNECALENFTEASQLKPNNHVLKFRLAQLYNIIAEEYKDEQDFKNMNYNLNEAKKYARQCRQIKKTYGGAYFELGVAELNLCNKATGIKFLQKAAKYDRRYRSEVKRIIKKIDSFTDHCE